MNSFRNSRTAWTNSASATTVDPRIFRPGNRRAFSLVEVVLALGIIGFAFIPTMGFISQGFSTLRDSNVDVKTALIAQKCMAEAQLTSYTNLVTTTNYFDMDGRVLTNSNSSAAIFKAVVRYEPPTNTILISTNIKNVTVTLTGSGVENRARFFSSTVANLGN
jgi:uncharacterized protein (TIGR02598 family)